MNTSVEINKKLDKDDQAMKQFEGCKCVLTGPICLDCSKYEFDFLSRDQLEQMKTNLEPSKVRDRVEAKLKDSILDCEALRQMIKERDKNTF